MNQGQALYRQLVSAWFTAIDFRIYSSAVSKPEFDRSVYNRHLVATHPCRRLAPRGPPDAMMVIDAIMILVITSTAPDISTNGADTYIGLFAPLSLR